MKPTVIFTNGLLGLAAIAVPLHAETRTVSPLPPPTGMSIGSGSRADVLALYHRYYMASQGFEARIGWNGNSSTGIAGTTSAAFKDDVLRRVNFYRALCSYPSDITFDDAKSAKSQQAALMMSANNNLSHAPPAGWKYYTAAGAEAAKNSNLALGSYGPYAIDAYMQDADAGNEAAGHRRWILYAGTAQMGTGDIPDNNGKQASNSLWVMPPPVSSHAPAAFACFPNEGFFPSNLAPNRWSISYPGQGVDFTGATVTLKKGAANIPVKIISKDVTGVGDNALIWTPTNLASVTTNDGDSYTVTVSGIKGASATSKTYSVTFFDPSILGQTLTLNTPATIPTQGATLSFNSITGADAYQVEVSQQGASANWVEGAEDNPTPQIISGIKGTYELRDSGQARTGVKAFHLAYPALDLSLAEQSFVVDRNIIPQATSHLLFYQLSKLTNSTNTLSAEVSTDAGVNWTSVWQRNGIANSNAVEKTWSAADVNLSSYAGKTIRVRFIARFSGAGYPGTSSGFGFYIDDVSVSNTLSQSSLKVSELPGSATSFTLNSDTAGAPLINGSTFFVRIRPGVGSTWFDYTLPKTVSVKSIASYADWVATLYPGLTGGFTGDPDGDGISNGVEYAFALNPQSSNLPTAVPQMAITGGVAAFDYDQPAGVTDLNYEAQWSADLITWSAMTDSGSGNHHHFEVSTSGKSKVFLRHVIEQK